MTSFIAWPERYPGRTFAAIGVLFVLAYSAGLIWLAKPDGRILFGDALHHYVQLRSAVFDRDLQFTNEYVRMYGLKGDNPETEWVYGSTPTGHVRNLMPVGPALLWAPLFLVVSGMIAVARIFGASYPLDGYAPLFQATAGFTGILAATGGAWIAYQTSATLFDRRSAVWATLTMWLASSAIYYSVISPTYSHAASMLAVSVFWFLWIRTLDWQSVHRYAALGVTVGIAALMRWQDVILMSVVVVDALWHWQDGGAPRFAARVGTCAIGAAIAFTPQMVVWSVLYGSPLTIPQGPSFMQWCKPALASVLFSDKHGLLSWTPVVAFAMAGVIPLSRRAPLIGIASVVFFLLSWYVNAAASDWWAGEAFGARRFLSCFPVLVTGLAALLHRWAPRTGHAAVVSTVFILLTFLLLVQYQAFMHGLTHIVPYPAGFDGLWLARFRAPFDLFEWWLRR